MSDDLSRNFKRDMIKMVKNCWDCMFNSGKKLKILSSWNENRVKIKISMKKNEILKKPRSKYIGKKIIKNYQNHYKIIEI